MPARIGVGGTGKVYRATDMALGREVASKMLTSELAADPERLARFERVAAPRLLPPCYQPRHNQALQERYFSPFSSGDSPSFVVLGTSWWWSAATPTRATNP